MNPTDAATIRIALADLDHEADVAALRRLFDDYAEGARMLGRTMTSEEHSRMISGIRSHPAAFILLARLDGEPCGMAVCLEGFSTFRGTRLVNIHDISVHTTMRARGIGTRLLRAVEDEAQRRGCGAITLEVAGRNDAARRLYERSGYSAGEPPTIFMTKEL